MKFLPFSGNSEIRRSVSTVPRDDDSVCRSGAAPVTSTFSEADPNFSIKSTRTLWFTATSTVDCTVVWNPCLFAETA